MKPATTMLDLIGNTPLVPLKHLTKDLGRTVLAKLEFFNPTGSVKDRIALAMINKAEEQGLVSEGSVVVEPTSGNTGIALSFVCAVKGYEFYAVLPTTMSEERKSLIRAYGGQVVCTPCDSDEPGMFGREDVERALEVALDMIDADTQVFVPNQFANLANPDVHFETTGPEIWEQTGGKVDAFVAAAGTGGTVTGAGRALKERRNDVKVCVVEPAASAVLNGCEPGFHRIQGIGEGFIPDVLDMSVCDDVVVVSDEESIQTACRLHAEEGIFGGISSGCNVAAAIKVAKDLPEGSTVVTIVPDNASRYFSTGLFGCARELSNAQSIQA